MGKRYKQRVSQCARLLGHVPSPNCASLYKQAKDLRDRAYELDPADPDIQKSWIVSLSPAEQIKFWEKYLSSPSNDDEKTRADLQHYLDYLRAMQKAGPHGCRPVSNLPSTEIKLLTLSPSQDPRILLGYTIPVSLNGKRARLQLDTGASGIMVDQGFARKAGIKLISNIALGGIGDKGYAAGYMGFAESVRIGDVEFQDCTVRAIEARPGLDMNGLVGSDIFSSCLVDIDFPGKRLGLQPLPRRPDDSAEGAAVQAGRVSENGIAGAASGHGPQATLGDPGPPRGLVLRDRYIAPEMRSYTQAYRFDHELLVPTVIGNSSPKFFLVDSGAATNSVSLRAARQLTEVQDNYKVRIQGLRGPVEKVYRADKAILKFGTWNKRVRT